VHLDNFIYGHYPEALAAAAAGVAAFTTTSMMSRAVISKRVQTRIDADGNGAAAHTYFRERTL
jgi:hypothetical protein